MREPIGKTSPKNVKLVMLVKQRVEELDREVKRQRERKGHPALIERLEEALAENELMLMRLENRKVTYH